jgi:hypothetical protein
MKPVFIVNTKTLRIPREVLEGFIVENMVN